MRHGWKRCLVFAAVFLLTGCGKEKADTEVYIDESKEETPITLFTQNESVSDAIEVCCKNLLKDKTNLNLTLYADSASFYAEEGLSYRELLLKRLASGSADDLYLIPAEDVMEFKKKGYIYDLSGLNCVDNLSDDALVQSTFDGAVFSIPLSYTCFGFVWNVDMLHEYGLEVPENASQFWNVCETLKQNGILPYGANKDFALTVPAMCAGFEGLYRSADAERLLKELSDGTTPVSTYMEKGFRFLETMIEKGYLDTEQALNMVPLSDEEKAFFAEGKCAFYCSLYRKKTFEDYPFEIQMSALPILEDGAVCVVGADQRLAVNPNSEHLKEAVEIVEMLGSKKSLDSFAAGLGKISSSKNASVPDISQSEGIVKCVVQGGQIPNQDFRVHFNVWDNVRNLGVKICQGMSASDVAKEYDAIQTEEIARYGER